MFTLQPHPSLMLQLTYPKIYPVTTPRLPYTASYRSRSTYHIPPPSPLTRCKLASPDVWDGIVSLFADIERMTI